jgi:hypothetical protein
MLRGEVWRVNGEVAKELLANGCWRAERQPGEEGKTNADQY